MRLFRSSSTTTLLACLTLVFLCSIGFAAEDKPERPGSPFLDPTPKLPDEMLTDKRLDQHVKVFVKSRNLHEFFDLLTEKTGVHIGASQEIQGERPIVFFRDRPLRDVLTEISGLYGYYWLAKGENGKWSYELFEDVRHSQKRKRARQEHLDDMQARVLEMIEIGREAIADPAKLEKLRGNEQLYESLTRPDMRAFLEMLLNFETSAIESWLAGEKWAETFEKLPEKHQKAIQKFVYEHQRQYWEWGQEDGKNAPEPQPWTLDELAKTVVTLKCSSGPRNVVPPHIGIRIGDPRHIRNNGTLANEGWPTWQWGRENWDLDLPPTEIIGDPLPKDKKITAPPRKYWFGEALLMPDVLEAVALQAGMDIIADYYLQGWWFLDIEELPVEEVLLDICKDLKYAGQVDGDMLRLRHVRWFEFPVMQEPPSEMLAHLWKEIEEQGTIHFQDILDIAALPEDQLWWPGLKLMPGAELASRATSTLKMWNTLSDAFKLEGREHAVVPVSQMTGKQQAAIYEWVKQIGSAPSLSDLTKSVVEFYIKTDNITTGKDVDVHTVDIIFPDGNKRSMGVAIQNFTPVLTPEQREQLKKERRADREADEVVLAVTP